MNAYQRSKTHWNASMCCIVCAYLAVGEDGRVLARRRTLKHRQQLLEHRWLAITLIKDVIKSKAPVATAAIGTNVQGASFLSRRPQARSVLLLLLLLLLRSLSAAQGARPVSFCRRAQL